ncbi:ECF transporter S component [Lactobacillus sp. LL6]|uniref:ECF transporter S component n=1 Tax=Lactobacillus sp. LL6 TaxID=2596827 RepID=UPI001187241E|nr:ECF transporter S component [Lactobacillus sp. LL6]TSO25391.1 ECF transporter S component [Lactobacillus sp. LL6]
MKRKETLKMTILAVFVALLIVQTFVPNVGYIRILPALPAITTIPLTIAVFGTLMGPKMGAEFGLIWGITRLIVAYTQPGDMVSLMLFQNPAISLIPSILSGYFAGLITAKLSDKDLTIRKVGYIFSGAVASLTNTFLVIGLVSIFFMNNPASLTSYLGNFNQSTPLFIILISVLGINGLVEAAFTAIVVPIIVTPLNYILKRA